MFRCADDFRGVPYYESCDLDDAMHPQTIVAHRLNGEPLPIREVINRLLQAAGAPPVTRSISFNAAYRIGAVCERLWPLLRLRSEPPMTRFLAEQLATAHWYSMEPARRDFGYVPRVCFDEGLMRLKAAWKGGQSLT